MKRSRGLLWYLFWSYTLVTAVALAITAALETRAIRAFIESQTADALHEMAAFTANQVQAPLAAGDVETIKILCGTAPQHTRMRFTVIGSNGAVLADSMEDPRQMDNHAGRPEVQSALRGEKGESIRYSQTVRRRMLYVTAPIHLPEGKIAVVRLSISISSLQETLSAMSSHILMAMTALLVLAAFASYLIARWLTRPLADVTLAVQRFAHGDFTPLHINAHSYELATLAESANEMASQLDDRIRTIVRQRQQEEALLSSMAEGVLAVDLDERVIVLNQAGSDLFGVDPATVRGRAFLDIVRCTALTNLVRETLAGGGPVKAEAALGRDAEHHILATGSALRNERNEQTGVVVVLLDVTRTRQLEQIRRDFVANVSHELRTPITSIRGFVETLRDGALDERDTAERFLEIIQRQAERISAIINDLLALSRLEHEGAGSESIFEESEPRTIVETAVEGITAQAAAKSITIEIEGSPDLRVEAAPQLIEQALTNLIDNAIKYTPAGGHILVTVTREKDETAFHVRDWGCGVSEEHLPRLCERFYRVDKARSRHEGGTGLGLSIVKHIAQAHGGRVNVVSAPGMGSTFSIYLPTSRHINGASAGSENA